MPLARVPPADYSKEITGTRTEQRVKMNRMRLRIAQRLKEAQNVNAMLTTFNEIDMRSVPALVLPFISLPFLTTLLNLTPQQQQYHGVEEDAWRSFQ